jgi:hypothetical protein
LIPPADGENLISFILSRHRPTPEIPLELILQPTSAEKADVPIGE